MLSIPFCEAAQYCYCGNADWAIDAQPQALLCDVHGDVLNTPELQVAEKVGIGGKGKAKIADDDMIAVADSS